MHGYVTRKATLMVKCNIEDFWDAGEAIRYLKCINEQGLRIDHESWVGQKFSEDDSVRLVYEFILSNDWSIEEEQLIDLRNHTEDYMHPTSFHGIPQKFELSIGALTNIACYLSSEYTYSQYGHEFGVSIAIAALITSLEMSKNDEHIECMAHVLIEALIENLEIEAIKPRIQELIEQADTDQELFENYDNFEAKAEKLYVNIDKCLTEYKE